MILRWRMMMFLVMMQMVIVLVMIMIISIVMTIAAQNGLMIISEKWGCQDVPFKGEMVLINEHTSGCVMSVSKNHLIIVMIIMILIMILIWTLSSGCGQWPSWWRTWSLSPSFLRWIPILLPQVTIHMNDADDTNDTNSNTTDSIDTKGGPSWQ